MDKNQTREKHLEFIQTNIARMNQCSFHMKGWAITIIIALITVFVATLDTNRKGQVLYLFMGAGASVIFWFLDAYYLAQERKFVAMYNTVAGLTNDIEYACYEINPNKYKGWRYCIFNTALAFPNILFYGIIFVALMVLGFIL